MAEKKLDAFVVNTRPNSYYLSLFDCSNSILIVTGDSAHFLTDFRYIEAAEKSLSPDWALLRINNAPLSLELGRLLDRAAVQRIGFEGDAPYNTYRLLCECIEDTARLEEAGGLLRTLRAVKDADEIILIEQSQKINEAVLDAALEATARTDGTLTELELQTAIRKCMLERGVEEAFATIVAFGASSSLPHAVPGNQQLAGQAVVLVDMGVRFEHYCSDMTRTFLLAGEDSASEQGKLAAIYDIVLEAQAAALQAVRAGVEAWEVDHAAREVIAKAGYGEYFGHGLGHGVGIEIHEAPRLGLNSNEVLREGMVVTIEPGIYLPGTGGVRIEDLVVVEQRGCRNLTSFSKSPDLLDRGRQI